MNKRVFSLILTVCMLLNIPVVFAENDLQIKTESSTINMSTITDENVLYKAMQNKNGIASINTDSNELTAAFDVVLGFDVPDTYDYSGEKAWLEQFRVLQEQAPDDTRFAVVTNAASEFEDLDKAIDTAKANGTSSTIAMSDLVDSIIDTFDRQSKKRTKVAIMAVGDTDAAALQSEMDKLRGEDIIPFAFVLNSDPTNNSKNFDGVYKCSSDLELRLNIADLYLSFGEFNEAVIPISKKDSKEVSSWCDSDFKKNHLTDTTVTAGSAMTSVLNMYKCLPIKAVYEDYNYNLSDGIENVEALIDFLKGNGTAINASSAFELWDAVYNNLAITDSADVGNPTNYENIIDKNLKRRFPVVANINGNISIISSYEPNTREIKVNAEDISVPLDDILSIVDTYEYLMTMATSSKRVRSNAVQQNSSITITKTFAPNYSVANNVSIVPVELDKLSTKEDGLLTLTADLSQYSGHELVIIETTEFEENIPCMYDSMPFYKLKFYNDVLSSNVWYYDYLLKATGLSIIEGDENGNFLGNDSVTRCQFIRMALQAAQISLDIEEPKWHTDHWAIDYMNKANELGILFWDDARSDDEIAEYFDEAIPRYEAAYILKTLLMDKRDNIKVPTLLYEYAPNSTTLQGKAWAEKSAGQFNGDTVRAEEAMYQLFMNSIFVGDENGNLKINDNITRSEAVKIVIKPLFELDEGVEVLMANIFGNDFEQETTGHEIGCTLDDEGRKVYNITVDPDGLYSDYPDGRLYKLSTTNDGVTYNIYDEHGNELLMDENEMYRLKSGHMITLIFHGKSSVNFKFIINDCWSPDKYSYIVVGDSYSDYLGGSTSRYRDANGENYTYDDSEDISNEDDEEGNKFFETYFDALGNRNIAFVLGVRDLYFSGQTKMIYDDADNSYAKVEESAAIEDIMEKTDYSEGKYPLNSMEKSHKQKVVEETAQKYINMIKNISKALIKINKNRVEQIKPPQIYLSAPHSDSVNATEEYSEDDIANQYGEYVKEIYYRVINDDDVKNSNIEIVGIYHGKEDTFEMYENGQETFSYKIMKASSNVAHSLGMKLLWIPYATNYNEWNNIGEVVNAAKNDDGTDVVDIIMIQPGLFFSNYSGITNEEDGTKSFLDDKQNLLYSSVFTEEFVYGNGYKGSEKITDTKIAFQIEYDISLITGRNHGRNRQADLNSIPTVLARNFNKTYVHYKDLIYAENVSFGIYAGGPNEQDYKSDVGDNINTHTIINHPSLFSVFIDKKDESSASESPYWYCYAEPENGTQYNQFFTEINADKYYVNKYNNRLIYDITKGLFQKIWSYDIKQYLGAEL